MTHVRGTVGALFAAAIVACSGGGSDSPAGPTAPGGGTTTPTTGTIGGRVTSAAGAGLTGAAVTTQPATSSATTDAQGNYSIASVAPGSYTVSAALSGYTTATASASVAAGQTASANITLQVLAGFTFTEVAQFQGSTQGVSGLAVSPDGRTMVVGEYGANTIRIVSVQTRQVTRTLTGHTAPVTRLAFSADGRYLASHGTTNLPPGTDGTVRVWDVNSGTQLASVATSSTGIGELAFSPDGTMLAGASGGDPLSVRIWTPTTLALQRTISGVFRKVAFSPDSRRISTLARDDRVRIVDVTTGTELSSLTGHTGWATTGTYNRAGTQLATGGEDRSIRIWDPATGQTTRTLTGHTSYPDALEFSPDGTVLASLGSGVNVTRSGSSVSVTIGSADQRVRLWTVSTGAALTPPNTGSDAIGAMAFSTNWSVFVTASGASGLIRIFNR